MTKDERDRLVAVEQAALLIPEIRADVKQLLAAYHSQQGFIRAGAIFVTALGALIGAAFAVAWPKIKALM